MGKKLLSLNSSLKKIFFTLTFTVLFSNQILAEDFLAKLTNNALSDNSQGVKKLTYDEASKVVGGYYVGYTELGITEAAVYAIPTFNAVDLGIEGTGGEIAYDKNGNFSLQKSGICSAGVTHCYMFNNTRTHYQQSRIRLQELMNIVGDPITNFLAFTAKANVYYTKKGERQIAFSYGVGIVYAQTGSFTKMPTSILDKNFVAQDLAANFKSYLQYRLLQKIK